MRNSLPFLCLAFVAFGSCGQQTTVVGGSGEIQEGELYGAHVYDHRRSQQILGAWIKRPDGADQPAFLLVCRVPKLSQPPYYPYLYQASTRGLAYAGDKASGTLILEIQSRDRQPILTYEVDHNVSPAEEVSLAVAGEERDPARGRVFLLDCTREPYEVRQIDAPLPAPNQLTPQHSFASAADSVARIHPDVAKFLNETQVRD